MPGHIKLGSGGEPDPDPLPYLTVNLENKRKDTSSKTYDPKRSVWAEDGQGGFIEGLKEYEDADKITVLLGHEKKHFKPNQVAPVNPPKFEKCEDMANLTFLNEASVFYNLKSRYQAKLIYTYSGLFCVVVNPYKRYPIYTMRVVKMYQGKRRNECPPHLWAVTEAAYRNMLLKDKDQSMLITGESGAGKTENTKKVISYLAMVATSGKKSEKKVSLEEQIVATNPILESYGNAKTSRNDNSSRFGKFIRIHFNTKGKLAGCDIKAYLFEKSRITQQQEVERSYHIFYQMLQPAVPDLKETCLLTDTIYDYSYVCQGRTKVDSINDNEELQFTDNAFDIIGFSETEKWNCYKLTAAVMSMGDLKFKQKGREEQCEPDKNELSIKVGTLCGIDALQMMTAFTKPKIKVGTEWVVKGQNVEQALNAVGGIARAIYHRTFLWLIEKCNDTLMDPTMKKVNFCAVLDIAGFEIFTFNGYEQLSINFVNEKLQQFFNHHMFVVEQEEYISEGIDWQMVDFGMDLAACIIMFEKPMGVWAILEEESLFPKATDKSLEEKLKSTLLGKCPSFAKPQSKTDKNAHFAVVHYAGTVSYNVTAWLEKNKDPVNDTVVDLMKLSTNKLMVHLWSDHPGQSSVPTEEKGKKKKGGGGKTVSSVFLVDLVALMATLNSTDPHFVRCIVPNTCKQPGGVDPPLIMHQLTCNGVLEGIRICMRGFPNRITYNDFQKRYCIIARGKVADGFEEKEAATAILQEIPEVNDRFRLGHTKVFFRAGALAQLEESRDIVVQDLVQKLQGTVFGYEARKKYEFKCHQKAMIKVIQRNLRKYQKIKDWKWFSLIHLTKPLIGQINMEQVLQQLESKFFEVNEILNEKQAVINQLSTSNTAVEQEINEMKSILGSRHGNIFGLQEKSEMLKHALSDLKDHIKEKQCEFNDIESSKEDVQEENNIEENKLNQLQAVYSNLMRDKEDVSIVLQHRDTYLKELKEIIARNDEILTKLSEEKKILSEKGTASENNLASMEEKLSSEINCLKEMEIVKESIVSSIAAEEDLKHKIESERSQNESLLKIEQLKVHNLSRDKINLTQNLDRLLKEKKDAEIKCEIEESNAFQIRSKVHDLEATVEKMEQELMGVKQNKMYAELSRSELARSHEQYLTHLDESTANMVSQMELNSKLEIKLQEMRKDKEETMISWESTILKLKKKHQEATCEMSLQLEALRSIKIRVEKDMVSLKAEIQDTSAAVDRVSQDTVHAEQNLKSLSNKLTIINTQAGLKEEMLKKTSGVNKHLTSKNLEMSNELNALRSAVDLRDREVLSLKEILNQATNMCENEERENISLSGKIKTIQHELDGYQEQFLDEESSRKELQFSLDRAISDVNVWKLKYEKEIKERVEELENCKLKLQTRVCEAEDTLNTLSKQLQIMENRKLETARNLEEAQRRNDITIVKLGQAEKRVKSSERDIQEWKRRSDDLCKDLNESQTNCRNATAELFRIKNGINESMSKLEAARGENKKISNNIKDTTELIRDGGRKIHDIENQRKCLEGDIGYLNDALEDIEKALINEESKLKVSNCEIENVKEDIKNTISDMEKSFEVVKTNHNEMMNSIKLKIEEMSKEKAEAARSKQKLESDILECEDKLNREELKHHELSKTGAKTLLEIEQLNEKLEVEQRKREEAATALLDLDRKVSTVSNRLEELKSMLEQVDRARRHLEQEVSDTTEHIFILTETSARLSQEISNLNMDLQNLQIEKDDAKDELHGSEERAGAFMLEAAQLAENLRTEQEQASRLEEERKGMETKLRNLQIQVDEGESEALRWGEKSTRRLKTTIQDLEESLESERRKNNNLVKNQRKVERDSNTLEIKIQHGRKNSEKIQELVNKMQQQINNYKKQIEEAEEIAALNLCKWKRVEGDLMETLEREKSRRDMLVECRSRRKLSLPPEF